MNGMNDVDEMKGLHTHAYTGIAGDTPVSVHLSPHLTKCGDPSPVRRTFRTVSRTAHIGMVGLTCPYWNWWVLYSDPLPWMKYERWMLSMTYEYWTIRNMLSIMKVTTWIEYEHLSNNMVLRNSIPIASIQHVIILGILRYLLLALRRVNRQLRCSQTWSFTS